MGKIVQIGVIVALVCASFAPIVSSQGLNLNLDFLDSIFTGLSPDISAAEASQLSLITLLGPRRRQTNHRCPANQIPSRCPPCPVPCEDRFNPPLCPSVCRPGCACPVGTFMDGKRCVTADQCPSVTQPPIVTPRPPGCPANQIPSRCPPCQVRCEDRFNPPVCPTVCTPGCGCPVGTFLNGFRCVSAAQCPRVVTIPPPTVDPCLICSEFATCDLTGDVRCRCREGYTGTGIDCVLFATPDPCGVCSQFATCNQGLLGGITCTCNDGYVGNGRTCTPDPCGVCSQFATCNRGLLSGITCTCNDGYIGNGRTCTLDPCNACSPFATCFPSGITCRCNAGYTGNGANCVLLPTVDPCGICSEFATCNRGLLGGITCTCNGGYVGNGRTCTLDPCNACSPFATCFPSGITCRCNAGYTGNGANCVLLPTADPCGVCSEFATCNRGNLGRITCACNDGYQGNGRICEAIPLPCGGCLANAECIIDSRGEETCACNDGFVGDGRVTCYPIPVDTCNCGSFGTCVPNPPPNGPITCVCFVGYQRVGNQCVPTRSLPVIPARQSVISCDPACQGNAVCINVDGNGICRCPYGYIGTDCTETVDNPESRCFPSCQPSQRCFYAAEQYACFFEQ
ncbi:uncharacterized protein LOC143448927 isoform X1 [Clavelina lepadiformis]|uniref:uncharacterized protein LOC143448927 isoform X1 n=1 Tax=Clavelina lepadiformis TaxID=159417 RepID=UPI0040426B0E